MTCVAIFTAASFACGAAPTLVFILIARVIQGAGGGALQPLSQAILLESFPPAKRGAAMAVFAFGVVVAPVLGPTLGGWLTDTYSWRYAFYINIPIGLLALFMINRFVHDPPYIKNARVPAFDNIGFGALVVWTGLLQVVLDKGQEDDWFGAVWMRWAFFFLITSFAVFVWHSWRKHEPMVDLKLLKNRNFGIGCLLIFLFGIAIYSTIVVLPLFYQELLGYTAFTAGLVVAPRGLGAICGMPIIGYLSNKVDPRYLLTFGFLTFGLTTLYFGNVTLDISPTTLLLPILITGFGLSFVFVPISTAAYGTLRNEQIGNASGLFNLMRNVGGSIGISIAADPAHPPHGGPPERDPQLRPPDRPAVPELPRRNPAGPHQQPSAPATALAPGPGHALPAARPPGQPSGPSSMSSAGSRCSASSASASSGCSRRSSPAALPPAH
jgi:DHA2 family multidrug resistance protein